VNSLVHGAKHLLAESNHVISQITFSRVLSEPRITFVITKSYHADSKDDALMSRLPG